jgi:hypothetical protein
VISGATGASYTTPAAVAGDNGATFTVTVSNTAGSITSSAATLTVNSAPSITTQPANQTVTAGSAANFAVVASGTAPLTYQWSKNGNVIVGATGSSYTTPATVSGDSGAQFSVVVSNSAGSVTSNAATLTVNVAPTITQQPVNQAVTAPNPATFTVVATGTAPLAYQWKKGGAVITAATSSSYTTPATTTADNGSSFTVTVSNTAGSVTSTAAALTVTSAAVAPSITTQPANQTVNAGQPATFSVVAAGTAPLSYQWYKGAVAISGATASSYTTPAAATTDNGAAFKVTVTNSAGTVTSNSAVLTVTAAALTDVLTYHYDNARTGQNLTETILTPTNVTSATFGKLFAVSADGLVDGQPLIVTGLNIGGVVHNVLYVVTEGDSVYSFDADTGAALVHVSVLGSGETTSDARGCDQVSPQIGITSTPVIDRSAGSHGTIYLVAMTKDASGAYHHRLHALDLLTLSEQSGSPIEIQATYPGNAVVQSAFIVAPPGMTAFDPAQYKERAGLLLLNGTVYTTFASHCDNLPYSAWIMGYNESTLAQTQVLNLTPNGNLTGGGSIWQSGGGMAADSAGNIFAMLANGKFDTTLTTNGFPTLGDYGNAYVKIPATGGSLQVTDYFDMDNTVAESGSDTDFGSGGPLLLPDQSAAGGVVKHLAIGAGKDGHLYVVDRDNMGKFSMSNNAIWQDLPNVLPGGLWATPAYYQGSVYLCDVNGNLRQFAMSQALFSATPASKTAASFAFPGMAPSVSANGSTNGIVWALENTVNSPYTGLPQPAVLHAYLAGNLATELYNSNQAASGRDNFGPGNKFITPVVANGKVYVGTPSGVAVFGLLP